MTPNWLRLDTARRLPRRLLLASLGCLALGVSTLAQEPAGDTEIAAIVRIDGEIDDVSERTLELRIRRAMKDSPRFLVLSIDATGSESAGHTIAWNLDQLLESGDVTTIAFIRGKALRGAAFVSFGCELLAMKPQSGLGNMPIDVSEARSESVNEAITMLRNDLVRLAQRRGYPVDVAAAIVDPDVELRRVTRKGPNGRLQTAWLSRTALDDLTPTARAKLLTEEVISPPDQFLFVSDDLAAEIGMCSMFPADEAELCRMLAAEYSIGEVVPRVIDALWWTEIVRFVTWWPIKILLFVVGTIALIMAFAQPGTGAPEGVFVLSYALVFFGSYLIGLTDWVELILVVIGIGLLAVEIFLTPGFGFMGGAGVLCLFAALLLSFQKFVLPSNAIESDMLVANFGRTIVGFGLAVVVFGLILRFLPRVKMLRGGLMHEHTLEATPLETESHSAAPVGTTCVATTSLRPIGKVQIGKDVYDAVVQDGLATLGTTLVVVGHRGYELIVSSRPEATTLPAKTTESSQQTKPKAAEAESPPIADGDAETHEGTA